MQKGLKNSVETKRKISIAMRGKVSPFKGKTNRYTEETILKMKLAHMGKTPNLGNKLSNETKKKISESNKGKHIASDEFRNKMSLIHKGKRHSVKTEFKKGNISYWKGRNNPNVMREKNPAWKGGITSENKRIRYSIEFRVWREAVFARDNWTCQKTGDRGCFIVSHHIQNFAQYPELRFAIDNGITLSKQSHLDFHNKYGRKNNTREQLEEFLGHKII